MDRKFEIASGEHHIHDLIGKMKVMPRSKRSEIERTGLPFPRSEPVPPSNDVVVETRGQKQQGKVERSLHAPYTDLKGRTRDTHNRCR